MTTFFNGFDTQELTFKTMSAILPKKAVTLQSSGDIYYADTGSAFTGIVSTYRNGIASVVIRGYAEVGFKNTLPTVGICKLSVGSMGSLEVDEENGKPYTVLSVDVATKTMAIIL